MKKWTRKSAVVIVVVLIFRFQGQLFAQQYNSDNYLSKPQGVATIILSYGERNSMFMTTFSLLKNWEFTAAAYLYNNDGDITTDDGHSASLYAKYMIYENESKTGGAAIKFGTGLDPGYLDGNDRVNDAFQTFWSNVPVTIGFLNNTISLDIMPGVSFTKHFGPEDITAWAFTYSTRVAWYPVSPTFSIVGEVYGSIGEMHAIPEYRIGGRWEPDQYTVIAVTYDDEFGGSHGAGFEIGLMLFTPPFFCAGGCD